MTSEELDAGLMFPPVLASGGSPDLDYAFGYVDETKPTTIPYDGPVLEPDPPPGVVAAAVDLGPDTCRLARTRSCKNH